jgi:DNA (cytosine-5)-methyltransferase 1
MAQPTVVSLFSGAGGLDIGLERAGFHTVSMCEVEPVFAASLRANAGAIKADGRRYLAGARIFEADIRDLSGRDLSGGAEVDCLVGGPPCQTFSSSGRQLSVLDPRGSLVAEFLRMVGEIRPRSFLFENVRGIVTARDAAAQPGGVIREVFRGLEGHGYSCRAALLNSADFGAHQRRVRCFILGVRHGLAPEFPEPTHGEEPGPPTLFDPPKARWRTLGEFLSCWADNDESTHVHPSPSLAPQLAQIAEGSGLRSEGVAEPTRPGGHWGYRQGTFIADTGRPARTVTGSSSQDWVRWNGSLRRLTLLEVKRLQGFPDDWALCGSKADAFQQVGNAVPTVFGEVIGAALIRHLASMDAAQPPVRVPFPRQFEAHIDYTERDHARNASARKVHRSFLLGEHPKAPNKGDFKVGP